MYSQCTDLTHQILSMGYINPQLTRYILRPDVFTVYRLNTSDPINGLHKPSTDEVYTEA